MLKFVINLGLSLLTMAAQAESSSWLQRCESALAQGRVNEVLYDYQQASKLTATPEQHVVMASSLGEALWRAGRLEEAEKILNEAQQLVNTLNNPALKGEVVFRLGLVALAKGQSEAAGKQFTQALAFAEQSRQYELAAAAVVNLYKQSPQAELLNQAQQKISQLKNPEQQIELKLALAYAALQTGELLPAEQLLNPLLEIVKKTRSRSQVLGYLGRVAEQRNRFDQALNYTEQAILADSSADLLMQWQWQRGRILEALNRSPEAISAYRQAVTHLQTIKQDIPVNYHYGASSFKATYMPLYMALIEKLWAEANHDADKNQTNLSEILRYWEQLKTAELQDYFREACAIKQKEQTVAIAEGTAVLYPILLQNRLLLVVRFKDVIRGFEVPVAYSVIRRTVKKLLNEMFNPLPGQSTPVTGNENLHQWILKPILSELELHHIDTLVYLPDGPLRSVPLSMFSDGQHYVAEHYKVVTVPGLSLLETSQSGHGHKTLLTGMSHPGPVVYELFDANLDIFNAGDESSKRGLRDIRQVDTGTTDRSSRAQQLTSNLALPGVSIELKKLSKLLNVEALENEQFTLDTFKQKIAEGMSFVHIATHGYFSGDPKKSFVMTYDHLLDMQQLSQIFRNEAFLQNPVDLMTLSACQTAEGDDRSPLGLSGVVVQTGVRSAIGTLWPVADEAAQEFFSDFYQHYQQPNVTKIQALQTAQQHLMSNPVFQHPRYWAPFILVGDWQ